MIKRSLLALVVALWSFGALAQAPVNGAYVPPASGANTQSPFGTIPPIFTPGIPAFTNQVTPFNSAFGYQACGVITTGTANSCFGWDAGASLTGAYNDTAIGSSALLFNAGGNNDTAVGSGSQYIASGSGNVSVGNASLYPTTGSNNTAVGSAAGFKMTSGGSNILLGVGNVSVGISTGSQNIDIGGRVVASDGVTTGSNNTIIGNQITGLAAGLTGAIVIGTGDGVIHLDFNNTVTGLFDFSNPVVSSAAAPTAAGAGGTCATGAVAGHSPVGTITLTGACAAGNTIAITFPVAAPIGYACDVQDRTTPAAAVNETGVTPTITTLTIAGTTSGATDVLRFMCAAY